MWEMFRYVFNKIAKTLLQTFLEITIVLYFDFVNIEVI